MSVRQRTIRASQSWDEYRVSGMNIDGKDAGITCSSNDYPKSYTLVVFDLCSEVVDASVQMLQKQGSLQLEIRFSEALPEAINVILYVSFSCEISIDQARCQMSDEMTRIIAGGV